MEKLKDRTESVNLFLRIMMIFGVWPWPSATKNESPFLVFLKEIYPYLLHLPFSFVFVGLLWLEAFASNDLEQAGQVLYMSITELAFIFKILNIWYQRTAAWKLMNQLQHSPEYELRSQDEVKLWQREQRIFKRVFRLYILVALGVVCSSCIGVLFLNEYVLPIPYFLPLSWQNEKGYWYAYSYDVACMIVTCVADATLDIIGCYFMFHISLLYQILGMRMRFLRNVDNEVELNQQLRQTFELHHRIRRLVLECQPLLSIHLLSQILLSALSICFSGYRLKHVGVRSSPGQFLSMIQFLSVMISQIFLPCFYGNLITFYADQLTNEVYNSDWLQCTTSTRKLLNTYMEHLKRPVKIRAGYFFDVGLPIFVKTINNAYSFFAILLNVSD